MKRVHEMQLESHFLERTVDAVCSCGWSSGDRLDQGDAIEDWKNHADRAAVSTDRFGPLPNDWCHRGECCGPGSWCCQRAGRHSHVTDLAAKLLASFERTLSRPPDETLTPPPNVDGSDEAPSHSPQGNTPT